MTFKHDITAEDSPLHGLEFAVSSVSVAVSARGQRWQSRRWRTRCTTTRTAWLTGRPEFQGTFTNGPPSGLVLEAIRPIKFRTFRLPNTEASYEGSSTRRRGSRISTFHVINPLEAMRMSRCEAMQHRSRIRPSAV